MKRLFVLIFGIIFPVLLWAWVGSNPSVGFNYPQDGDVVSIPFTPKGWCYNTENGIDYYEIWLIEDTNDDSTISETELDNKTVIIKQENKQENEILEHKNKGFNMNLSNKDKSDDDFETF